MSPPEWSYTSTSGDLPVSLFPSLHRGLVKCAPQGGEVHVTLKDKPPYSGWNVK